MALQTSGAISLSDVAGEFGGSAPHSLSEYYGVASGIPSSGTISLSHFYGAADAPTREPASGYYYQADVYHFGQAGVCGNLYTAWAGANMGVHTTTSFTTGGWTYYRGPTNYGGPPAYQICGAPSGAPAINYWDIYRESA